MNSFQNIMDEFEQELCRPDIPGEVLFSLIHFLWEEIKPYFEIPGLAEAEKGKKGKKKAINKKTLTLQSFLQDENQASSYFLGENIKESPLFSIYMEFQPEGLKRILRSCEKNQKPKSDVFIHSIRSEFPYLSGSWFGLSSDDENIARWLPMAYVLWMSSFCSDWPTICTSWLCWESPFVL